MGAAPGVFAGHPQIATYSIHAAKNFPVRKAQSTLDVALAPGSLMLSAVMVSGTTAPIEASKVAATVNFLSPEQVRTSPARGVQDLLREIPGIEMPRTSSSVGGTAQIVSVRGVDEGRTAVLVDGIPINDAWGEWIDWDRVSKSRVERVEVFEGGASSLYGNGAMGGVISLFTRPAAPGSWTAWVASMIVGWRKPAMIGKERMSTTRLL